MPSTQLRGSNWVFTINNPGDGDDFSDLHISCMDAVRYCTWQLELGSQGTRHLQGWIVFKNRVRRTVIQQSSPLLRRAYTDVQRGSNRQAYDYARKSATRHGGPWEFGQCPDLDAPTGRALSGLPSNDGPTGWDTVRERILSGDRPMGLLRDGRIRSNGIWQLANILWIDELRRATEQRGTCDITVFTGPTGTGKSSAIWNLVTTEGNHAFNWVLTADTKWWDGYNMEPVVIMDDFEGEKQVHFRRLLNIWDRYPTEVEIKGGFRPLKANKFYVSSNLPPSSWYPGQADLTPLYRRITSWLRWASGSPGAFVKGYPSEEGDFIIGEREFTQ